MTTFVCQHQYRWQCYMLGPRHMTHYCRPSMSVVILMSFCWPAMTVCVARVSTCYWQCRQTLSVIILTLFIFTDVSSHVLRVPTLSADKLCHSFAWCPLSLCGAAVIVNWSLVSQLGINTEQTKNLRPMRQPRTHFQTTLGHRTCPSVTSNTCWRHFLAPAAGTLSALEPFCDMGYISSLA